jgi:phage terminase large subunit-like protein
MRERQAYVARQSFPTRGDKAIRAQSIRGRMAIDGLHYDAAASWRSEFERELLTFPAGKTDDQVDALGLIGQILDRMTQPQKEHRPEPLRGALEMTLKEAWLLARPRLDGGTRI